MKVRVNWIGLMPTRSLSLCRHMFLDPVHSLRILRGLSREDAEYKLLQELEEWR